VFPAGLRSGPIHKFGCHGRTVAAKRSSFPVRVAAAAAYVEHGATQAGTTRWQQALIRKLTALGLREQLTMVPSPPV
jgi:hypothetical protein